MRQWLPVIYSLVGAAAFIYTFHPYGLSHHLGMLSRLVRSRQGGLGRLRAKLDGWRSEFKIACVNCGRESSRDKRAAQGLVNEGVGVRLPYHALCVFCGASLATPWSKHQFVAKLLDEERRLEFARLRAKEYNEQDEVFQQSLLNMHQMLTDDTDASKVIELKPRGAKGRAR